MAEGIPKIKVNDLQAAEASQPHSSGVSPVDDAARIVSNADGPVNETKLPANGKATAQGQPPRNPNGNDKSAVVDGQSTANDQGRADSTAIDPLSRHILKRTQTEGIIPQKLRTVTSEGSTDTTGVTATPVESVLSGRSSLDPDRTDNNPSKDKKKGVSFLSRLINNKKKEPTQTFDDDDESEQGDRRIEGMDAHVFSQPLGFIPQFPQPPKYIKVRSHNKKDRDFNRLFLAQELPWRKPIDSQSRSASVAEQEPPQHKNGASAIWALEFSKDGKYLAAAGVDRVVRVWSVLSTTEERQQFENEEDMKPQGGEEKGQRLEAPVFKSAPIRMYEGHTGDVLDLSWSKNNFLLSSSMDKTVRLWHVSRSECLCAFKHSDFVTSISFHPRDDRFFLAGSLDSKLRLWSIPDKSVAFFVSLPDLITAVSFTPDGKTAIAGCLSGICLFYETEGLKYQTQLHVRSSHGRNAKGSKITGIQTMTIPPDHPHGETKLLITSNDSRIRLYNFRDKSLEMKFRGNENACSQIHASFSDDARYIICGSEDRKAFIWSTGPGEGEKKDKHPVEMFEAHKAIVTNAKMAPNKTKQLLSASGDPVYDLCNPPRVTLISRNDSKGSSRQLNENEHRDSDAASIPPDTPNTPQYPPSTRPTQSEAWINRSAHSDGNIIVTTDYQGQIKVFRQDCAHQKRRNDSWETSSTFSKRVGSGVFSRASTLGGGRQSSFTQRDSSSINQSSDRILSWRNSIGSSNASLDSSLRNGSIRNGFRPRSTSPRKSGRGAVRTNQTSTPVIKSPDTPSISTTSPPPSVHDSPIGPSSAVDKVASSFTTADANDPLMIQPNGQSLLFYNSENWRPGLQRGNTNVTVDSTHLAPVDRKMSRASALSSEEDSSMGERTSEEDGLKCAKCGGRNFKVSGIRVIGKGRRTVCTRCGTEVA